VSAQHLGHAEHQVGSGRALGEFAHELHPDHLGEEHVVRLPEHDRLGLDSADPPADHADPVDHRGVRVGTDQGVGIGEVEPALGAAMHDRREVLQIHLVHDPGAGGDDAEVLERLLGPPQQGVSLSVSLVLPLDVQAVGVGGAEVVDLHRVVDDEVGGDDRIDLLCVAAHRPNAVPHRCEVHHGRDAGKVLEYHA